MNGDVNGKVYLFLEGYYWNFTPYIVPKAKPDVPVEVLFICPKNREPDVPVISIRDKFI